MYLTVHAAAGALVASVIHNPAIAFAAGFGSHFILDFIPHGDEQVAVWIAAGKRRAYYLAAADTILTTVFAITIAFTDTTDASSRSAMLYGILGGILPDFFLMVFPKFHEVSRNRRVIIFLYKVLQSLGLVRAVSYLNMVHRYIHTFILRHFGFKLSFWVGLVFQIIFALLILKQL